MGLLPHNNSRLFHLYSLMKSSLRNNAQRNVCEGAQEGLCMGEPKRSSVFAIRRADGPVVLKDRAGRAVRLRLWAARAMLIYLLGMGCFMSLSPWGRSLTRSALLLPALMDASE